MTSRRPSASRTALGLLSIAVAELFITTCGGGGTTSSNPPKPPPAPPLVITTTSLPDANVGVWYGTWIQAEGGRKPWKWSLAAGSPTLPPGLELKVIDIGYGLVEGTPTQPGTFDFTVQLQDSGNPPQTAKRQFTLVVGNRLVITTTALRGAVVGRPYEAYLEAAGGTTPYIWSLDWGSLPQGLVLNSSTGEISGTPTGVTAERGPFRVTDSSTPPESATAYVGLAIQPPLEIRTARLSDAVFGKNYPNYIEVQGGVFPYTLRMISGSLPPGVRFVSFSANSIPPLFYLSGAPTQLGVFQFAVEVADSDTPSWVVAKEFSIQVNEELVLLTTSLPSGMTGEPYSATLAAKGGVPPYIWSIYYKSLPPGLSLNSSSGELHGVPTEAFHDDFGISVQDSSHGPQWVPMTYTMRIVGRLAITSSRLPRGRPEAPYRIQLGLFGGTAPYMWSITSGNLPSGLSLGTSTGQITGTPTTEGTFNFTVQVTDTGPPVQTVTKELNLTIASNLGRNDDPATATPISNGTFRASISPFADPVAGPANPDHDFYELAANSGSVVTIETTAKRLTPESPLDTVLEIVDAAGNRPSTCRTPYGYYDGPCINDDIELGTTTDSRLEFQVPDSETGPVTFFVHVFSWDGNARPDYVYELTVSGAN